MLDETLEKVRQAWLSDACELVPPLTKAKLDKALSELRVTPTAEIYHVFSHLNGFVGDRMDGECFQFWSIEKMLVENDKYHSKDRGFFIHFADFLIDSHTYAFKQNHTEHVWVYCHYDDKCILKVASSFEEFFGYYLRETRRLFPN